MRVALGQICCRLGDVDANVGTIVHTIRRAAKQDCDLLVLPEMADTGYDMQTIVVSASSWDEGPARTIAGAAAEAGIAMICGLSERDGERIYNTAGVWDRKGNPLGRYRKTHLFSMLHEDRHFARGDSFLTCPLGEFTCGMMICYDIRFPEIARSLTLAGADLLVVIAAWPMARVEHWLALCKARAIENQAYVVAVNRAGDDGPLAFGGNSVVFDPHGVEVARAPGDEPDLIVAELSRAPLEEVRSAMRVFEDRRPDLYRLG